MSDTSKHNAALMGRAILGESLAWVNSAEGAWSRTLELICDEWGFGSAETEGKKLPIEIPDFGRANLASLFHKLEFTKGVEVGVKCGEYSEVLLKANPNLHLFGIDPYQSYEAYRVISQERQDQCRAEALERLAPYIKAGRYTLIEKPSVEAAKMFADGEIQFAYVDASHKFEDVVNDIAAWSRVLRPGSIMAGHDYLVRKHGRDGGPNTSHHVVAAINGWASAYGIDPFFVLGRKRAPEGEIRDRERSWLWATK